MFNIGGGEMFVLAALALLIFGPEGLPGVIKNVMRTVRAVRRAASDFQHEVKGALELESAETERKKRLAAASQKAPTKPPEPPSETDSEVESKPISENDTKENREETTEFGAADSDPKESADPVDSSDDIPSEDSGHGGEAEVDGDDDDDDDDDDDGPGLPMIRESKTVPEQSKKEDPS